MPDRGDVSFTLDIAHGGGGAWERCGSSPELMRAIRAEPGAIYLGVRARRAFRLVGRGLAGEGQIQFAAVGADGSADGRWRPVAVTSDVDVERDEVWEGAELSPARLGGEVRCLVRSRRLDDESWHVREVDLSLDGTARKVGGGFALSGTQLAATWVGSDTVLVTERVADAEMGDRWVVRTLERGEASDQGYVHAQLRGPFASVTASAVRETRSGPGGLDLLTVTVRSRAGRQHLVRTGNRWFRVRCAPGVQTSVVGDSILLFQNAPHGGGTELVPGTLLMQRIRDLGAGRPAVVYVPGDRAALVRVLSVAGVLVLYVLDRMVPELHVWSRDDAGALARTEFKLPPHLSVHEVVDVGSERALVVASGIDVPPTLIALEARSPATVTAPGRGSAVQWAPALDGQKVPFHVHWGRGTGKTAPTVVLVYGGFGHVSRPRFMPALAAGWTSRGYNVVIAAVRGGGELGPAWAAGGRGADLLTASNDLNAVAVHVLDTGVADRGGIGLLAASNGALVALNAVLEKPGLYGSAVLQSGVFDLQHGAGLPGGGALMAALGLDSADTHTLRRLDPLHRVHEAPVLPPVLVMAADDDHVVPPEHSVRLAAALRASGASSALMRFRSGGHYLAGPSLQATANAAAFEFLAGTLRQVETEAPTDGSLSR